MHENRGRVEEPGRGLRNYGVDRRELNRFSGHLPAGHDPAYCHQQSQKKKLILEEMKKIVNSLNDMQPCDQWDTWETFNNTPGPYRFNFYKPKGKPWAPGRVKSRELVFSQLKKGCDCINRNGLQDDCRRLQCQGRKWCMEQPYPLCPPFTGEPRPHCDPDPYKVCPSRPWEEQEGHMPAPTCPPDPVYQTVRERRQATAKVRCPSSGQEHDYLVTAVSERELPDSLKGLGMPVFKLVHQGDQATAGHGQA